MWRPADFVLRGEYCTAADIERQLEVYRDRYELDAMALFTCETAGSKAAAVFGVATGGGRPALADLLGRLRDRDDTLLRAIADAIVADERTGATRPGTGSARPDRLDAVAAGIGPRLTLRAPHQMSHFQPIRPVIATVSGHAVSIDREHAELLYSMIISEAGVRRAVDTAVMTPLDELLLIPQVARDGLPNLREMTARAEQVAVARTRGHDSIVVWRAPYAVHSADELAGWATDLDRPTGSSDGGAPLGDRLLTMPSAEQHTADGRTILACPIPGVLAGPHTPAVGAVLLRQADGLAFSSHEITLVRAICLRLAVLHSAASSSDLARVIAELSAGLPPASPDTAPDATLDIALAITLDIAPGGPPGTAPDAAPDGPVGPDGPPNGRPLPPDVELALAGLRGALDRVAANTNSHSVSLRVALGSPHALEDHGLALQKVVGVGLPASDRDPVDLEFQNERAHGGLNWHTALTGRPTYAPDVDEHPRYRRSRTATRSELSVPVRAGGELVGVLNLESPSLANYGPSLPYVHALAGAIGRRFADAALSVSRPLLERTAEVLDAAHLYAAKLHSLEDHAGTLPLDAENITMIRRYIGECYDLINSVTARQVGDGDTASASIERIVDDAMADRPVLELEVTGSPAPGYQVPARHVPLLASAVRSVLSNLKKHRGIPATADPMGVSPPRLRYGECTWDGQRYALLTFTNPTGQLIPARVASQVYRIPIERQGELRLGAYLASLRLRQVGGRLSFSVDAEQTARTVMMVPVRDETSRR